MVAILKGMTESLYDNFGVSMLLLLGYVVVDRSTGSWL